MVGLIRLGVGGSVRIVDDYENIRSEISRPLDENAALFARGSDLITIVLSGFARYGHLFCYSI